MSNLFLNEDGLRVYSEEVKEEISESIGNLSEFSSEQIADDYEFATGGGSNIVFSFDADKYERVTFTAYVNTPDGFVGGSMLFRLLKDGDGDSSIINIGTLASFSLSTSNKSGNQRVEIDCSELSGSCFVEASGGGSGGKITFGAKDIKGIAKNTKDATSALNYLDGKVGDLSQLNAVRLSQDKTFTATGLSGKLVTFDITELSKISLYFAVEWDKTKTPGGTFTVFIGKESPEIKIGYINAGGTQKEVVGRFATYDCKNLMGEYSLFITGGASGTDYKVMISDFYGYIDYPSVVDGVNNMVTSVQNKLGDTSDLDTVAISIPFETQNSSPQNVTMSGRLFQFDVTDYKRIQFSIYASSNSWLNFYFKSANDTSEVDPVAETQYGQTKIVEIDCTELTGEYALSFSGSGTVKWSDITMHRIVGTNVVESINAIDRSIDMSDFGKKTKLASDYKTFNFSNWPVGWQKIATVTLDQTFDTLTFTAQAVSVGRGSHTIVIAPAGELPDNVENKIFIEKLDYNGWCRKKFKVNVAKLYGDYDIYIYAEGANRSASYTDICSFTPINVGDVTDALNYLLSFHN